MRLGRCRCPRSGCRSSGLVRGPCRRPTGWPHSCSVAPSPMRQCAVSKPLSVGLCFAEGRAGKPRDDLAPADREQFAHQRQPLAVRPRRRAFPVEHGGLKRRCFAADPEPRRHISHRRRRTPCGGPCGRPRRDRREIAEERERLRRSPFLAHEQQGDHRRQQRDRQRGLDRSRIGHALEPVAERAVADLVVVLQEIDEGGRRQMAARLAARRPPRCADGSP